MDEMARQLTVRVDFDEAATEDEISELRNLIHDMVDEWCCVPAPEGMESEDGLFHRTTMASTQLAWIDPA